MTAGNLGKWLVKEGQEVQPGAILADIETDKATINWENQDSGCVRTIKQHTAILAHVLCFLALRRWVAKLLVKEGDKDLPLGSPLLVLVEEAACVPAFASYKAVAAGAATPAAQRYAPSPAAPACASPAASQPAVQASSKIGPAARMLMAEHGLSPSDITTISGPHAIITKGDVLTAIAVGTRGAPQPAATATTASTSPPAAAAPPAPAPPAPAPAAPKAPTAKQPSAGQYTDLPVTQIRKIIAQRLLESKTSIPGVCHLTRCVTCTSPQLAACSRLAPAAGQHSPSALQQCVQVQSCPACYEPMSLCLSLSL